MGDSIYAWSTTASSNASADSAVNWAENMAPDAVNDSARQMMARIAALISDLTPQRSSTGTSTAYAVTAAALGTSLTGREVVTFFPHTTNTGPCTLNVGGTGAKAFRPKTATAFSAGDLLQDVPVVAYYDLATDEWIATNSGYYVSAMAAGLSIQSIVNRLPQIGDMVVSLDPSGPGTGRIRLTEATQTLSKATYPELDAWLSARSYPWGSALTTFNLPPAAGYFLRFAPTSTSIDPDGARTAGATQSDAIKSHTHGPGNLSGTAAAAGAHSHTPSTAGNSFQTASATPSGSNTAGGGINNAAALDANTSTAPDHTHSVSITAGLTDANGSAATETRPKNVAFYIDVIASTGSVTSSTVLGYTTGAGGTVTQATSKSTSVTLNKQSGQITMNNAALAAGTIVGFTLNNSLIAANDVVIVNIVSGATSSSYRTQVAALAAGSCRIELENKSGGTLSEAVVLNFAIVRGSAS